MESFVAAVFESKGAASSVDRPEMVRWMCQVPEHVNEHLYIYNSIESTQEKVLYYSQITYNPELRILICYVLYE